MKTPAVAWLRLEGAAVVIAAMLAYHYFALSWRWFLFCFLLPDVTMLGYLAGPRIGAWAYNLVHNYVPALALLIYGLLGERWPVFAAGLILCAHIGLDRALGYGLKSNEGFRATHLGALGQNRQPRKRPVA